MDLYFSSKLLGLQELTWISVLLAYFLAGIFYNFTFHPLAKFPGPLICAVSNIPYSYWFLSGRQPYILRDLHKRYGPVVRTAPGELSFISAQSWRDIYGGSGASDAKKVLIKGNFYAGGAYAGIGVTSIVSEQDPEIHREMRRYLSNAFSERSVVEQETIVLETIDRCIDLVDTKANANPEGGLDMSRLMEMLTFDITGDLAFGQSFDCISTDTHHPWIDITLGSLAQGALVDVLGRFPWLGRVLMVVFRSKIAKLTADTRKNEKLALDAVQRRIRLSTDRKDFLTRILEERDPARVSDAQIAAHAHDLVVAGSDTSATALATCLYYLHQPRYAAVLEKLRAELRGRDAGDGQVDNERKEGEASGVGAFTHYDQIDSASTVKLPYLRAVLLEALRVYPPLPLGLPRTVPAGGAMLDGWFVPGGATVSTNPLAASHSADNFADPLEFRPERWIEPSEQDVLAASQPFSLGPRGCIGRNLAWMEMRCTLAKLIWTYDFELVDPALDWHAQSQMHTLWIKPALFVRATKVAGVDKGGQ
ncbi:benzoate 4-monooxygenase cytochrome P450 [Xylariales sp. PMI_506]|nr:benzoate 4-monooxygenase cytochrome P450 [Xylariales sp. PMI_506]